MICFVVFNINTPKNEKDQHSLVFWYHIIFLDLPDNWCQHNVLVAHLAMISL
jgi:hypothetical protein